MKFNVLVVTPLILSALLATASVGATNPNVDSDGNTSAMEPGVPDKAARPTIVNKSGEVTLGDGFKELLLQDRKFIVAHFEY
ncbi:hypothetical protein IWQ61_006542, partial [Dispira simplex]